jgi:putative IMPACT (imprinted ancient) family translation regulator
MTYMVRPRMQLRKSGRRISRISSGAFQLLVGPASSSLLLQMKVRSSTRATSAGLKRDKKYAKATHNSWGVLLDGVPLKSDDGESGAGMVILRMLERAERSGELIIVTRWYGGKHLGGDRFRHVQEATRLYLDHPAS